MRFGLFIPGDDRPDPSKLDKVGLAHLRPGANFVACAAGPDRQRGVIVSWPITTAGPMHFISDVQEWIPAVANGDLPPERYWVGFINGAPPVPGDLLRSQSFEGGFVVLGDGNAWKIPAAGMLPMDSILAADGQPVEVIRQAYRDFWDESQYWFDWLMTLDFDNPCIEWSARVWKHIERALIMNYLLLPEVISHLRLINTETRAPALLAIMGGMQIREDLETQKKSTIAAAAT